ncbi:MAG: beta-lactamase family protein [Acidobacteria bacterium]|nr:beta-lactamase family protein [Acidobacteriota bacterium]MBV9474826.1 beta-lactamase family protein [Acidobacteriota bacterium]
MKRVLWILLIACTALAQQPRKIIRIGGGNGEEVTKDWPKLAASDDAFGSIDALARALNERDLFAGTVLIAKDGKPLLTKSYGKGNDDDTKYNIGSINKIFTQVALLQLRDVGKLDFSKTLRTYLPDFPSKIADRITIQQLIDHSSGMGDVFGERFAAGHASLDSLQDYLKLFADQPLQFEPGTEHRYSNAGYIALGLVIEKLSGQTYYDYIHNHIYKPAGMMSSGSFAASDAVANRATGMTGEPHRRVPNTNFLPARGSSAGGGYATAADLLRFTRALPQLLGAKTYESFVGKVPGVSWAGGTPGANAVVELEGPYTIIVLSNYDPPSATYLGGQARVALGLPTE